MQARKYFECLSLSGYYEALREINKQSLLDALHEADSNYGEAAKLLGIHPNTLHRLLRDPCLKHVPYNSPLPRPAAACIANQH